MITFDRLDFNFNNFGKMWRNTYTSMYSSTWSNRVRSGGYLGRLLITYSSPSLILDPLDSLNFLLDFMGPCLIWHFGALREFGSEPSGRGQWKVDWSFPSSRKCLAASAHLWITVAWGRFGTNPEVDGVAPSPEPQANCCEKAGSSGWMGRFSLEWVEVWCSQAEALYHCILGLCSKLQ